MINPSRRIHRAIWPPFATTVRRAIARPRPDPWFLRLVCCLDATERKKNLREHRFRYAGSQIPNSNDTSMGTAGMGEVIKLRTRSSDSVLR